MTELLSEELVVETRMLRFSGCSLASIKDHLSLNHSRAEGKPLQLSLMTISRICDGSSFANFGGPRTTRARAKKLRKQRKLYGSLQAGLV